MMTQPAILSCQGTPGHNGAIRLERAEGTTRGFHILDFHQVSLNLAAILSANCELRGWYVMGDQLQ